MLLEPPTDTLPHCRGSVANRAWRPPFAPDVFRCGVTFKRWWLYLERCARLTNGVCIKLLTTGFVRYNQSTANTPRQPAWRKHLHHRPTLSQEILRIRALRGNFRLESVRRFSGCIRNFLCNSRRLKRLNRMCRHRILLKLAIRDARGANGFRDRHSYRRSRPRGRPRTISRAALHVHPLISSEIHRRAHEIALAELDPAMA